MQYTQYCDNYDVLSERASEQAIQLQYISGLQGSGPVQA